MSVIVFPCVLSYDFGELDGSPQERISSTFTRVGATRRFKCAYEDRIYLAAQFVGQSVSAGGTVVVYEPHSYWAISGYLMAIDVSIDPFGKVAGQVGDDRFATYDYALITVTYGIPQRETSEAYGGNVTVIETLRGASEFLTLPTEGLYWGKGTSKKPITNLAAPGKISCLMEWTYAIRGALTLPSGFQTHPGKVNQYAAVSNTLGWTFPVETLLCNNPEQTRELSFDGASHDLTLKFMYKNNGTIANPKGWNYFPKPNAGGTALSWEPITDGTDDKEIYTPADFGDVII